MKKILIGLIILCVGVGAAHAQFNVNAGNVAPQYKYFFASPPGVTTIKATKGYLNNIIVEGGGSGFVTFYDSAAQSQNTAANVIVQFDAVGNGTGIFSYPINVIFSSGVTVNNQNGTKMTVSYL